MGFDLERYSASIVFPPNMFVGPDTKFLIEWGAKYVPCMRKDISIFANFAKQREIEVSACALVRVQTRLSIFSGGKRRNARDCTMKGSAV